MSQKSSGNTLQEHIKRKKFIGLQNISIGLIVTTEK
jgi:hypothetical protein